MKASKKSRSQESGASAALQQTLQPAVRGAVPVTSLPAAGEEKPTERREEGEVQAASCLATGTVTRSSFRVKGL